MPPTVRSRKIQLSIKLPQDIEQKVRAAVNAGDYSNITDAVTGMLRLYFKYENLNKLYTKVDDLKLELDMLKLRNEHLEKKMDELIKKEEKEE